jgi:flavin reductase (DIM6/NTAB) family NADH-FMN oxidoreductase RutF
MLSGRNDPDGADGDTSAAQLSRFLLGGEQPAVIVTAAGDDGRAGCLVGFTTQVSIHPPRLLVLISMKNATYRVADRAAQLAVHLVREERRDLAELFGGETADDGVDKFEHCRWTEGVGGVPLLDDCPDRLIGRVGDRLPMGDHCGFLLDPIVIDLEPDLRPLRLAALAGLRPGHPA